MLPLGERAAVVAGDVGDQFQVVAADARQPAVADQVVAVLVVLVVIDDIAHVLEPGRGLEQHSIGRRQVERRRELLVDPSRQRRHRAAMFEFAGTGGGEPLDRRLAQGRIVGRCAPQGRLVDHLPDEAVADAAGVDEEHVDAEPAHQRVDDRQAGDDDVGPVGRHARQAAAGAQRHLAQAVEQVADLRL